MSNTKAVLPISVKLPDRDLRRIPVRNRSAFVREAVAEKLERLNVPSLNPRTETVRAMLALRRRFVAGGGELLDAEGVAAELRQRRGGLA